MPYNYKYYLSEMLFYFKLDSHWANNAIKIVRIYNVIAG